MAKYHLDIGAQVYCQDGGCGKLHKVVVDPYTQRVTDLIVEQGFLLTTDRVLPVETVEGTGDGDIRLGISNNDLETFPEYRELEFKEPAPGVEAGLYNRGDVQCWNVGYQMVCPEPVIPMVRRQIRQGIGGNLVVVERGTPVRNAHEPIGSVDHLLADAESGEVTHLVIRKGILPYYPVLSLSAIKEVSDEAVLTDLTEKEIDQLPRYRSRSSDDIQSEVRDRLVEFDFDVAMITIHVAANVVKLTGWVPTVVDKRQAEAIARSVEGVIEVENELDTDVAIQTRVVYALLSDPRTVVSIIRATAERGVVTLKGNVDDSGVRDAAEEVAAQQSGVLSIVNELEVVPDRDTPSLKGRWFASTTWSLKITGQSADRKE